MFTSIRIKVIYLTALLICCAHTLSAAQSTPEDTKTLRVFIFAGQSNMVGSDSNANEIDDFASFMGTGEEQTKIRYSYAIGRESMHRSNGWSTLQPINNVAGPELSFGKVVSEKIKAPIAIIKCASGGTTLGGDWNPDDPSGFKLYPLAFELIQQALQSLESKKIKYRIEGFFWHQGENDMFNEEYKANYAANLRNFIKRWRNDLNTPALPFYIGELSCKTVWGMDNRDNMYAISEAQKEVCDEDARVTYIPTNHVGVLTQSSNGLHYHYGTLGQLEHGHNYATQYLNSIGKLEVKDRSYKKWPLKKRSAVKLFVLAGHRNMEGEISFTADLRKTKYSSLRKDNLKIPYSYSTGGGFHFSEGFEPLGPTGSYDTFGPELSFATRVQKKEKTNIAIAKFTHSGSQIIDWTPDGSDAKSRNLYPEFLSFVKKNISELEALGHTVELAGIFYHLGENDMSLSSFKENAVSRMKELVDSSRQDLGMDHLKWFVSQQPPAVFEGAAEVDIAGQLSEWSQQSKSNWYVPAPGLLADKEHILMNSNGVINLGLLLADAYLKQR
jgi:hypothetical protein